MTRNNNIIPNDLRSRFEKIDNNVKKIEKHTEDILNEKKQQNIPKKKNIVSDKILTLLTVLISFISLIVAAIAAYSSNKLAINNSALIFSFENIDIKTINGKDGIKVNVGKNADTQGCAKIYIDVKVKSGQIASLYLIQEQNGEFIFNLLNDKEIQDKSSGIKSYSVAAYFDMEEKETTSNILFGMAQFYILSEDMNGKISIDVIQISGPIIKKSNGNTILVNLIDTEYSFRYLKNNKLVTLYNNDNINEEWVNLTDLYPDAPKETNIEKIKNDIAIIKEMYSTFKY